MDNQTADSWLHYRRPQSVDIRRSWIDRCAGMNGDIKADWGAMVKALAGSSFACKVDPTAGRNILESLPVIAGRTDWCAFLEGREKIRAELNQEIVRGDFEGIHPAPVIKHIHEWQNYPPDCGGKVSSVKRMRAIARVMRDQGIVNNTWLAQIMEAITGETYDKSRIRKALKD